MWSASAVEGSSSDPWARSSASSSTANGPLWSATLAAVTNASSVAVPSALLLRTPANLLSSSEPHFGLKQMNV